MQIEKVNNGYILTSPNGEKEVFTTLDEAMGSILSASEGRYASMGGNSYGIVKIFRKPGEKFTSPGEVEPT